MAEIFDDGELVNFVEALDKAAAVVVCWLFLSECKDTDDGMPVRALVTYLSCLLSDEGSDILLLLLLLFSRMNARRPESYPKADAAGVLFVVIVIIFFVVVVVVVEFNSPVMLEHV